MEVLPPKQPWGRKGEQDVSNTFGVDVGRLGEGKADWMVSESQVNSISTPFPCPKGLKAYTPSGFS